MSLLLYFFPLPADVQDILVIEIEQQADFNAVFFPSPVGFCSCGCSSFHFAVQRSGINSSDVEVLTLSNVTEEDAGEYICKVSNYIGEVSQSGWLTVISGKRQYRPRPLTAPPFLYLFIFALGLVTAWFWFGGFGSCLQAWLCSPCRLWGQAWLF